QAEHGIRDDLVTGVQTCALPIFGIGKLNEARRAKMKEWIEWATPLGKTPLCYSLIQGVKDFPADWKGPRTVILVSDGMETCGGRSEERRVGKEGGAARRAGDDRR